MCQLILQIFNLIFLLGHLSQNIPNGHLLGQKLVRNDRNAGEGPRVTRPGVQLVCFEVIHTGGGWSGAGLAPPPASETQLQAPRAGCDRVPYLFILFNFDFDLIFI